MINNLRAFQEVLKRNNLPTPDTYLGISELIRSLYRPDVSPNPERIREVLEELTWPVTVPAGNPITFKSCSEVLASEAIVNFSPRQSGTGDPSPENVRPISGWNSLELTVSDGDTDTEYTATFPSTEYGGNYDFVSGKLIIDTVRITFNGTEPGWSVYGADTWHGYNIATSNMKIGTRQDGASNMLICSKSNAQGQTNSFWLGVNNSTIYLIGVYDLMGATLDEFKTYLSNNNLQITYPLATPTEITLTPADVNLLKGSNTVWTDGDNVTVKFQILK